MEPGVWGLYRCKGMIRRTFDSSAMINVKCLMIERNRMVDHKKRGNIWRGILPDEEEFTAESDEVRK